MEMVFGSEKDVADFIESIRSDMEEATEELPEATKDELTLAIKSVDGFVDLMMIFKQRLVAELAKRVSVAELNEQGS